MGGQKQIYEKRGDHMAEKILILTLGTGSILKKEESSQKSLEERKKLISEKIYGKEEFCYRSCRYKLEEMEMETEFVAEPLVKKFRPQYVFILGTVKSAWTSFYTKFNKTENKDILKDNVLKLYQIENDYGCDTGKEELERVEAEINAIYRDTVILDPANPAIQVNVILTRYGIKQEELEDNYEKISDKLENILENGKKYEVAFDITHSFRSLPLYNLVILNYFKYVTQYDIDISHVYYGNLEVSTETKYAYIVDLKDLIQVLKMTNGISEFKNTGNATTLLPLLEEDSLQQALKNFDWATQLNAFNLVESSLEEVLQVTQQTEEENKNIRYADLKNMLGAVIKEKFFKENDIKFETIEDFKNLSMAEKQYILSRWYLEQNRYGQAVVTALEALRSYLMPMYLRWKEMDDTEENQKKENNRKAAVDRLRIIRKKVKKENEKENEIEQMFCELEIYRIEAKKIRDEFAHNLEERARKSISRVQKVSSKEIVKTFISLLGQLRKQLKERGEAVYEIYTRSYEKEVKEKIGGENNRLIITSDWCKPDDDYKKYKYNASRKREYTVYKLPEKIQKLLACDRKKSKVSIRDAMLLVRYIQKYFDDTVNLILSGISFRQMLHFVPMLQEQKWKLFYETEEERKKIVPMPKIEYDIENMFEKNKEGRKDNEEEYLNIAPVEIDI
jgi:CRISPR-associated Csx2 family protein